VFIIINCFIEENEINWGNCIGTSTVGAQSMPGRTAGLQALVRKKTAHIIWTHFMVHRQRLPSVNMGAELQTVFHTITIVVNCAKNSPLRGDLFTKLHNSI
jgi:hypothetical protein